MNSLNHLIQEKGDGLVQQCTSSPHFICLQTRFRGKTLYLYFGRGASFQGFDFSEIKIPVFLRTQDKFLQFARKYWRGMRVLSVHSSEIDRIVRIDALKEGTQLWVWLFWRGRDLFFAHRHDKEGHIEIFKSWVGFSKVAKEINLEFDESELFGELGYGTVKERKKEGDLSIKSYFSSFKPTETPKIPLKKINNTRLKIEEDLKKFEILKYLEKQTKIDLTEVNKIGDGRFSVSFRGLEGHFKKREHLFNKIKKWKKSEEFLRNRLAGLRVEEKSNPKKNTPASVGKTVQPIWKLDKKKQLISSLPKFIKFSYKTWTCYLGRTAIESDQIRKEIAKKEDWWLHLDGHKSGHMFLKSNDIVPNPIDLGILGSAMVELNGLSLTEIPLIFTKVKNLKGVKGVAGMVNYKKEKHMVVYFDQEWRQNLTSIEEDANG